MASTPKRDLTERVLAAIDKASPLERLRFLVTLQDEGPALRANAIDELVDAGWSRYAISQELGISSQRLYAWKSK